MTLNRIDSKLLGSDLEITFSKQSQNEIGSYNTKINEVRQRLSYKFISNLLYTHVFHSMIASPSMWYHRQGPMMRLYNETWSGGSDDFQSPFFPSILIQFGRERSPFSSAVSRILQITGDSTWRTKAMTLETNISSPQWIYLLTVQILDLDKPPNIFPTN